MKFFIHALALFLCLVLLLSGCNTPPDADTPAPTTTSTQTTTTTVNTADLPYIPGVECKDMEAKHCNWQYYALHRIYDECLNITSMEDDLMQYHEDPKWLWDEVHKYHRTHDGWDSDYNPFDAENMIDFVRLADLDKEVFTTYYEEVLKWRKQYDEQKGIECTEEWAEKRSRFSYEDIDVLYSGDQALINQHFKSSYAVLTNKNEILPLLWLVEHTVDEWLAAGVTLENMEEPIMTWKTFLGDTFLEQSGMREKLVEFFEKTK